MVNQSFVTEFQLLGVSEILELHILYFVILFLIYLAAMVGNLLIIIVVVLDHCLQAPMYFFLANLSVTDLGYISVTILKAMVNSLKKTTRISYTGCVAQTFFLLLFGGSELFLLTMMAYDRYVAICNPLNYVKEMNRGTCVKMATSAWIFGLLDAVLNTACTFTITFCSNNINQFFCEIPQLLKLSCPNSSYLVEIGALIFTVLICLTCFCFTVMSYVQIFRAVFTIPSVQGQKKAFATCLPHLLVLSLFYFTGMYTYLSSGFKFSSGLNVPLAMMYSVVPPFTNPIIYSMRNKEIIEALHRLSYKIRKLISI